MPTDITYTLSPSSFESRFIIQHSEPELKVIGVEGLFRVTEGIGWIEILQVQARENGHSYNLKKDVIYESEPFSVDDTVHFEYGDTE